MFFFCYGTVEFLVRFQVFCVDAVVADLLEMFFRDMLYEPLHKFQDGEGLSDKLFIFVTVVMEGDGFPIITVNSGSGDDRGSKVTSDILDCFTGLAFVRLGVNIKPVFMVTVYGCFHLFKGFPQALFQFIQENGLKRVTQEAVVEMSYVTPQTAVADAAFRDEAVDMWVPFQIPPEGMEDTDEAGSKRL